MFYRSSFDNVTMPVEKKSDQNNAFPVTNTSDSDGPSTGDADPSVLMQVAWMMVTHFFARLLRRKKRDDDDDEDDSESATKKVPPGDESTNSLSNEAR